MLRSSVSRFSVMNKEWNGLIGSVARAHSTCIISRWQRCRYCWRNEGCHGLPAIIEVLKIGRCTRGGKGFRPSRLRVDDSLAQPHTASRGLRDERVAWFNNAARSSEMRVRPTSADNHYYYRATCARLCAFYVEMCVHVLRGCATCTSCCCNDEAVCLSGSQTVSRVLAELTAKIDPKRIFYKSFHQTGFLQYKLSM